MKIVYVKNMKIIFALVLVLYSSVVQAANVTSSQALDMLMKGNRNFVQGKSTHPSYVAEARDKHLEGQSPFAVIVSCSDSRVPPELIFDRGLGDLFVVRDAGNVIGPIEMESVIYAIEVLHAPLILVLGHQNCGAVKAALQSAGQSTDFPHILTLIDEAINDCDLGDTNPLFNAIKCNVRNSVETLQDSTIIAPLVAQKKVKIVGGYFDIGTGKVSLVSQ